MSFWQTYPDKRLMAEISLWSADSTRFADEIQRIDEYADLYHIDVCDDHFVPGLLFYPDLVSALRPLTKKAFHVHLMADRPLGLIDEFAAAGADMITVHIEIGALAPAALARVAERGKSAGLAVGLDVPLETVLPYLDMVDVIVLMGTPMGIKGVEPSRLAVPRIQRMRTLLAEHGYSQKIKIESDGGIRTHTVPGLRAAGTDLIVMGSLAFKSTDLHKTFSWVHGLAKENN